MQGLLKSFTNFITEKLSLSLITNRLRSWTINFVNSIDYQEIESYVIKKYQEHLSSCDQSRLLEKHSAKQKKVMELEVSEAQVRQLKYGFKLDLSMYMARIDSVIYNKQSKNPTCLENDILRVIKILISKSSCTTYINNAEKISQKITGKNLSKIQTNSD